MLELKNVTLRLKSDDRTLVEDFSFTLGRGDRAVLIGEEGNGKSTLLQFIADRSAVESYCECSGTVVRRGTPGGTASTVRYARARGLRIESIWL